MNRSLIIHDARMHWKPVKLIQYDGIVRMFFGSDGQSGSCVLHGLAVVCPAVSLVNHTVACCCRCLGVKPRENNYIADVKSVLESSS